MNSLNKTQTAVLTLLLYILLLGGKSSEVCKSTLAGVKCQCAGVIQTNGHSLMCDSCVISLRREMIRSLLYVELGKGVPRTTCVTYPGSFRTLAKGNNSNNIDTSVMDLVHDSWPASALSTYKVSFQ